MKADQLVRMAPGFCPAVEALLDHERSIVPQVAIVRARALARARAALGECDWALLPGPGRRLRRLFVAAAASVALLASAAAAFQLTRASSSWPLPTGAPVSQAMRYAQAAPTASAAEASPPPAQKAAPAPSTPATSTAPAKASAPSRPTSQPAKDDGVLDELRLLERAQKSDARGDFAAVLAITTDLERRYSAGRLREERDVLRLRALVGLGKSSEARSLATRFRRDFPRSVLLPKLDEMLAAAP
jgi:hypothetical protein